MKPLTALLAALASTLLSGCVLLPIPHEQWASPRFHGAVTDAITGRALEKVKVTLRDYGLSEKELGPVVALSDQNGSYSVLASRYTMWTAIWLGPAEGPQHGTLVFEFPGYETTEEKKSMFGSAYARSDFEVNVRMRRKEPNQPPEPTR